MPFSFSRNKSIFRALQENTRVQVMLFFSPIPQFALCMVVSLVSSINLPWYHVGRLLFLLCSGLSPTLGYLRNRLRQYPGLVNCTTIDWFTEWPKDALMEVAERYLEDIQLADSKDAKKEDVDEVCLLCLCVCVFLQYFCLRQLDAIAFHKLCFTLSAFVPVLACLSLYLALYVAGRRRMGRGGGVFVIMFSHYSSFVLCSE